MINRSLKKWHSKQGMTMAELLIVVAIIGVISGVAFIAVWTYQRSMGQLERDGIAKQIFIAAQNHLSAARGEGYLGKTGFGTEGKSSEDLDDDSNPKGNYYFVVTRGRIYADGDDVFELMLPFGALDETIRAGGSYLIRYNKDSGTVMDVFYCTTSGSPSRFNHSLTPEEYETVLGLTGDSNKAQRRTYVSGNNSILGWYGGAEGIPHGEHLDDPKITIHNDEILWVDVTDSNEDKGASLQLRITGETSGAEMVFILRKGDGLVSNERVKWTTDGVCHVILDDITTNGRHFLDLNKTMGIDNSQFSRTGEFQWGENIKVEAVAYNETAITNIAYSGEQKTNSLFQDLDLKTDAVDDNTVSIKNFRHFENLDKTLAGSTGAAVPVSYAEQTEDMIWDGTATGAVKPFIKAINDIKTSFGETGDTFQVFAGANAQTANCLYPVSPAYLLHYDGKSHSTSRVKVDISAPAGLFGTMNVSGSSISNLELLDFVIDAKANTNSEIVTDAGALVGVAGNIEITNVLAHDSSGSFETKVHASNGNAGGLIGSAANTTVTKSAAALVVEGSASAGSASAGGLIGYMSGGSVTASYAGGHTNKAKYYTDDGNAIYNVSGATAGGLIGSMTGGSVSDSYSTCSASGETAGGFVGANSGTISGSNYCTGLVNGTTTAGAFAGTSTGSIAGQYLEIINEVISAANGASYLPAVGGGSAAGITRIDATAQSYDAFCGAEASWNSASPYDDTLYGYYNGKYNLRSVARLDGTVGASDFVAAHYGDWPAPEALVINK